ncbi:hypothetical protein ACWCPG_25160, partial [Streptomyces sp. NPDC001919]
MLRPGVRAGRRLGHGGVPGADPGRPGDLVALLLLDPLPGDDGLAGLRGDEEDEGEDGEGAGGGEGGGGAEGGVGPAVDVDAAAGRAG